MFYSSVSNSNNTVIYAVVVMRMNHEVRLVNVQRKSVYFQPFSHFVQFFTHIFTHSFQIPSTLIKRRVVCEMYKVELVGCPVQVIDVNAE